ncbi:hypothetical protein T472_0208010 [Youngiibacter fragilis 232.1]|uniref:Uncharacterized protein n=1 Tax=Youngiibacter fragilis 232.1 TaxID=994573 RepID=V7I7F5_9CLOT|nr:hypothetical protein T472_0208010 [Youngiibacter fragilis 232.1]
MSAQRAEGAGVQTLPIVGGKADFLGLRVPGGLPVFERSEKAGSATTEALGPTSFRPRFCLPSNNPLWLFERKGPPLAGLSE